MMHLQPTPLTRIGPLLAALCIVLSSQAANVAAESAALPSFVVCRTSEPIVVDGRLDEPAWSAAKSLGSFQFPWFQEGVRENSVVKLLWDAENLYIGCVCEDRHIAARAAEHDGAVAKDDCMEIMIAPDPSRPNRYFNVEWNVLGGYVDGHRPNAAEGGRVEWNAEGVQVKGCVEGTSNDESDEDQCWTVETVIPLANFRESMAAYPPAEGTEWRANFNRHGGDVNQQFSQWSAVDSPTPAFHAPHRFGTLRFSEQSPPLVAAAERRNALYGDRLDLTYLIDAAGQRGAIATATDWNQRRAQIVAAVEDVMGPLPRPAVPQPLEVEVLEEVVEDDLIRRKLAYHTDRSDQRVTAWLLLPRNPATEERQSLPAMLCLHQTTTPGKDQPVGLADRPSLHYALELTRRGYVTLSPDYPSLGEYAYDFESDEYVSGSMKAIYDNTRAIDLLQSLPEVDPDRIGCIGHSLGGHNGLFTALFDDRLKVVVTCCGFTRFARYMGGDLTGWTGPRYMPRIASNYGLSPQNVPFDFSEIIASLAPRGVFVVAPLRDANFDVVGVRETMAAAAPIFALLGAEERLVALYPDAEHDFPAESREAAYEFIDATIGKRNTEP
ncbi:MAG: hypothetical protein C0485_18775 [Pirellula sp.]|nr:hypothetical protein [Pirellula sp.]